MAKRSGGVRIIAWGGLLPDIFPQEGISICLIYLRQKPIFEILGLLFNVSKTSPGERNLLDLTD